MKGHARTRYACPHCGGSARIRYSKQVTPIYREGVIECQNADCGWRGKFSLEYTNTMTPSQQPNPHVTLPIPARIRESLLAQLMAEAN